VIRDLEGPPEAVAEALREPAGWAQWWPALHSVERLEAADGIELVRIATPLYEGGRPVTIELVEEADAIRFREVGHSHDWGLWGRWSWETIDRWKQRVTLELAVRNELYRVLTRSRLQRAAESWVDHLARRTFRGTEPPAPSVEIFQAGAELWMQYQGRTYRLIEQPRDGEAER
jgi:hypothetical protein